MRDIQGSDIRQEDSSIVDAEFELRRKSMRFRGEKALYWLQIVLNFTLTSIFALLAVTLVCVYLWHMAGPETCHWLSAPNLDKLERFSISVMSGVAATLSVSFFFRRN